MDMFSNFEKLIVSQQNRVDRLTKTLADAQSELAASREILRRMEAEQPKAVPPKR